MSPHARKLAMAGGVFVASLLMARVLGEPKHLTRFERLVNARGMPLRVLLLTPDPPPPGRVPASIVVQPVNTPTEYGQALSLELVAEGYPVLTFDWRGWGPAENRQFVKTGTPETLLKDLHAAIAYLRSQPGIDPERIVITGHSAGGTMVIEAGTADPRILAVAAIGMEADVTPTRPHNLLWALGLYDEFRTLTRMRDYFWASANTVADVDVTVGDFHQGTARRLAVSPTADHFTELQDRFLQREIVNWFNQASGKPPVTRHFWMQTRQWLFLAAWISALLMLMEGLLGMLAGARSAWPARIVALVALAAIWGMTHLADWNVALRQDGIQLLLVAVLVVGFAGRRRTREAERPAVSRAGREVIRVAVLAWLSLLLTLIVNNVANYFLHPLYLFWIPVFALQHLADLVYVYTLVYPHYVFFAPAPLGVLIPRWWVYLVVTAEVASPGLVLGTVAGLARRRPQPERGERRRVPVVALIILGGLMVALGVVIVLRLQEGFLTSDSALAAGRFLLRFAVLPIVLFAALRRATRRIVAP